MSKCTITPPFFPIVYVRGYAGSQADVEATVADPYMGFNLGATKVRQRWTGEVERHYFESPLLRLMKDFEYRDVYEGGEEMPLGQEVWARSVFIYRYYDEASTALGPGRRDEIEDYARGLGQLIVRIRERICDGDTEQERAFKVLVVAHSMGGLVTRCFLQSRELAGDPDVAAARRVVDKVFTYATPHNGIDLRIVGNVPSFFSRNNADNFNRDRMRRYLGLDDDGSDDVASLGQAFDPERFFCLVGTNHTDYEVAGGWSRRVVGPLSDGLVRITNATTWAPGANGGRRQCPRAFVHRSHSGHYGIVNSEDGYQNLIRFLFGNVRVDGVLEVEELTLPPEVQKKFDAGQSIRASYHFDVIVRVRGGRWDLHRRTVETGGAVFRQFDEMFPRDGSRPRHPHLFSAFLSTRHRVKANRPSLGFSIDLAVHVPEYEIDKKLWFDDHYAGGFLFRDKLNLEAIPPEGDKPWRLRCGFDSDRPNQTKRTTLEGRADGEALEFRIPLEQRTRPGMKGTLVLRARPWA